MHVHAIPRYKLDKYSVDAYLPISSTSLQHVKLLPIRTCTHTVEATAVFPWRIGRSSLPHSPPTVSTVLHTNGAFLGGIAGPGVSSRPNSVPQTGQLILPCHSWRLAELLGMDGTSFAISLCCVLLQFSIQPFFLCFFFPCRTGFVPLAGVRVRRLTLIRIRSPVRAL